MHYTVFEKGGKYAFIQCVPSIRAQMEALLNPLGRACYCFVTSDGKKFLRAPILVIINSFRKEGEVCIYSVCTVNEGPDGSPPQSLGEGLLQLCY